MTTVEIDLAGLDLGGQVIQAHDVGAGGLRQLRVLAAGEHRHAHRLAGAMRHHGRAAHLLVGLAGIDAEVHCRVDGLRELGGGELLDQLQRLVHRVLLAGGEPSLPRP